jgi:hypothetical protein
VADSSQAAHGIFKLRLESLMNLARRDVFSVEKLNDQSLLVDRSPI